MNRYEVMQQTVDNICRSLKEKPDHWAFQNNTFYKKSEPSIVFIYDTNVTRVSHNENTPQKVFSDQQGAMIAQACYEARRTTPSDIQLSVIKVFN